MSSQSILENAHPEVKNLLRTLFESPAWPYYEKAAGELIQSVLNELAGLTDPISIYRAQGKIEGIRLLLSLKDTLISKQPNRRF